MRSAKVARSSCLVGCALACSLTVAVPVAHAAELEARGPAECPDAAELGFRVERSVGVTLPQAPALRLLVEMQRGPSGYLAQLRVSGESKDEKVRSLSGANCSELADAVVVAMTLALGAAAPPAPAAPEATPPGNSAPPESHAAAAASPAPAAIAHDAPQIQEPAATSLRPALSLAALVDAGSLPEPGLGAALGVELSRGRLQLRALATLLFEQHTQVAPGPGSAPGADLQLFAGTLLGCTTAAGQPRAGLSAPVCLGFDLGRLSGTGTGVTSPRSGSALWAAPRADAGALWCLHGSPVCLSATLTAAAPLARSRFALAEIGTVYRPSAVVGRLSLGFSAGFD